MSPEKDHPDQDDHQPNQKHENGYAVDTVHITHPFTMRCVRISFFDIEVFCNLSPNSHKKRLHCKDIKQSGVQIVLLQIRLKDKNY